MHIDKEAWRQLLDLIGACDSPKQLSDVFELLFTIEEREQLADRVIIMRELFRGKLTQRELAKQFDISIAKITRGSNCLKGANQKLCDFIESHLVKD